jgi:hypothetical protein
MNMISTWAAVAQTNLKENEPLKVLTYLDYQIKIISAPDSLWMTAGLPNTDQLAFRLIFTANDPLKIEAIDERESGLYITARNESATYRTSITFPDPSKPIIRYTTTMEAKFPVLIPYWPKDILPLTKDGEICEEALSTFSRSVPAQACCSLVCQNLHRLLYFTFRT